jgi:hypothetical protein
MRIVSTPEIIAVKLRNTAIFKAEVVDHQYLIKLFYTNISHLTTYYFYEVKVTFVLLCQMDFMHELS